MRSLLNHRSVRLWLPACVVMAVMCGLTAGDSSAQQKKTKARGEIAITFDELPVSDPFGRADKRAVTFLILDALKQHEVTATGFVVGQQIESDYDLLGEWLNAGHTLGSMTNSNQDYNDVDITRFITEVRLGHDAIEEMLLGFGQRKRFFRYPFLNYGPDARARSQSQAFLKSHNVTVAHATVVPDDYMYDMSLSKFGRVPDSSERVRMRDEYLNHLFDELERVEQLSIEIAGRPVKQILRLRANRLNAFYLDDLLTALSDEGFRFITLEQALADPIYKKPEAYFESKGVGYIDRLAASDPDLIPAR